MSGFFVVPGIQAAAAVGCGVLPNGVQVTTVEGATGIYTEPPGSWNITFGHHKAGHLDPVWAGALLTYTIRVTTG